MSSIDLILGAFYRTSGANNSEFNHNILRTLGVLICLLFSAGNALAQQEGTWYRDQELRISFHYSNKFVPAEPAELSTRFVVNWRTRKSRSLILSCYLKAIPTEVEDVAGRLYLKNNSNEYAAAIVRNTKSRAFEVEVLESRPVYIDGLQAFYIVMDASVHGFDATYELRTFSLRTFWEGHEVIFECGTSLMSAVLGDLPVDQAAAATFISNIENEIKKTLRTLHFQRH